MRQLMQDERGLIAPAAVRGPFLTGILICSIFLLEDSFALRGQQLRRGAPGKEEPDMTGLLAKDIMHPRVSLYLKDKGDVVVNKLLINYPGLPVVNDESEVVGIVSEYEVLDAMKQHRTVHEFSAESIMSCGHAEHSGVCADPVTVSMYTPIEEVAITFYEKRMSVLPVVDDRKKLIGIIGRKNIIVAITERGFWPQAEFQKRAA
jgi:CBS-domain-containing membrane protein